MSKHKSLLLSNNTLIVIDVERQLLLTSYGTRTCFIHSPKSLIISRDSSREAEWTAQAISDQLLCWFTEVGLTVSPAITAELYSVLEVCLAQSEDCAMKRSGGAEEYMTIGAREKDGSLKVAQATGSYYGQPFPTSLSQISLAWSELLLYLAPHPRTRTRIQQFNYVDELRTFLASHSDYRRIAITADLMRHRHSMCGPISEFARALLHGFDVPSDIVHGFVLHAHQPADVPKFGLGHLHPHTWVSVGDFILDACFDAMHVKCTPMEPQGQIFLGRQPAYYSTTPIMIASAIAGSMINS